jgi:hypothetical protein
MNTLKIRDRIVEIKEIPGNQIRPNPLNWRVHPPSQVGAMKGILAEIGSVDVLKVVPLPDGAYQLVDGHLRAEIMGDQPIRCAVLDLTEAESREVLATFDPLGALAERNQEMLDDLLEGLDSDSEALQELLDTLKTEEPPPVDEWSDALGKLPTGEKSPFQQMTFTLHDSQVETVKEAMEAARKMGPFVETGNENGNGNALARVCEMFLGSEACR